MRMYTRWAERHGFEVDLVDELRNDEAGIRNATLAHQGRLRVRQSAKRNRRASAGAHQPVRFERPPANFLRRSRCDAGHRRRPSISTSSADDLRRETFRSGGPGGQHQNKTESGVRYVHIPTGIAAESRSERSQHKNDATALALLKSKLYKIEEQKRKAEVEKQYDEKGEVAWGYQIRNYVMQPYTLVKDQRTDAQTAQVQNVLDGEIDEFIQAYLRWQNPESPQEEGAVSDAPGC